MMRGAAYGLPHTATPTSAKRLWMRSKCVAHDDRPRPYVMSRAWSNCMSEKTMRSGTSSGLSFAPFAALRMRSHAASKSVEPPHGARFTVSTFCWMVEQPETSTHEGRDSKVSMRSRKAGAASSETRMPSAMATSIGVPLIEPLTSTSGTSLPRSTCLGSADARVSRPSRPTPEADAAWRTSRSRCSVALASASTTPSRIDRHCACIRSASTVERPPRMHFCAISCGWSALPFTPCLATRALRRLTRAATRAGSSGWRLPVASSAGLSFPLSASLRKALRHRCRQSEATRPNSISSYRPAAMSTSVVLSAAFRDETSVRYLRLEAAALAEPNMVAATRFASLSGPLSKCVPSRGAYLATSDSFGTRPSSRAAASSASSARSCSTMSEMHRSCTLLEGACSTSSSRSFQ
mmetsp:Transcript_19348/g.32842  ORF Transcript_19348/g.32842 Transcript_19348/m.32842 type:complete len:408 (-) Transcript_19348:403-1626(-)